MRNEWGAVCGDVPNGMVENAKSRRFVLFLEGIFLRRAAFFHTDHCELRMLNCEL